MKQKYVSPVVLRCLVLLLILAPSLVSAATYSYATTTFGWVDPATHTNAAWTNAASCTGGGAAVDDDITGLINLGFTFNFGGVNYTQVRIMSNGRLQFNNTFCGYGTQSVGPPRTYPYGYPNANVVRTMKVYGADFDPGQGGTVRYASLGTAPNRYFVVTWSNVPEWNTTPWTCAQSCFNLQVILYESGEFVYQYGTSANASSGKANIGWELTTADYGLVTFTNIGALANTAYRFYIPVPYAEYRMEQALWNGAANEVVDNSGYNRHGAAVGLAQTTSSGKICRGADIPNNTTTGTISAINTGIDMNSVGGQGGISFWYRLGEAWNANNRQLFDATTVNNRWFFLVKRNNRQLRFVLTDSANNNIVLAYTASNYAANTWVHIAVTWDMSANRYYMYVNGAQVANSTSGSSGSPHSSIDTLYIGDNRSTITGQNGTGNSANGVIDEFRLYNYAISSTVVLRDYLLSRTCSTLDHFAISHGGTGVNCQAEPITITAHDASHSAVSQSATTVGISTATAHGDWTLQTGAGTLVNSGNGAATYTFNNESSVVLLFKDSYAETTNINLNAGGVTETGSEDSSLTFAPSGFRFIDSASVETIANQVAGVTSGNYYLQAVRTDTQTGACVGVFNNQTVNIRLASQCNNPTTCAGQQVSFNGTPIASNPNSGVASYAIVPVSFLNDSTSRVLFTFSYPDVGQISLHARYTIPLGSGGASPNDMVGASNPFVVKPFGFTVAGIQRTSDAFANPGAASAVGPKFIHAGESFTATVTATAQGGAAAPNYGRETVPESVLLTPNIVLPAAGVNPALTNGTVGSFTNGVTTPMNLAWSEVGIITLTPSVGDGDYLGAGDVTGTVTGNVGRFVPHHFAALGEVIPACVSGAFSYMAQNFTLAKAGSSPLTGEMLEARNLGDTKTANYTGAFAPGLVSFGLENADNGTDLSARLTAPGSWSAGVYTLSSTNAVFSRPVSTAPDTTWGAFDQLEIGITAADADVTTTPRVSGADMNPAAVGCGVGCTYKKITAAGGTKMRYGRARLNNAHGSELLALPVPLKTQYYNGTGFVTNSLDSCTAFTLPVAGSPCTVASCVWGDLTLMQVTLDADKTNVTIANNPLLSGVSQLNLSAPLPAGSRGAVDLTLNVPAWLEYNWTGVVGDPNARATFGLHRKADQFIYQRENY